MKTIADHVVEVLQETDNPGIMFGDCTLLDMVAVRCTHTNLMEKHPMERHRRILNALEKDDRFEKLYCQMHGMRGNQWWRSFKMVSTNSKSKRMET